MDPLCDKPAELHHLEDDTIASPWPKGLPCDVGKVYHRAGALLVCVGKWRTTPDPSHEVNVDLSVDS